MRRVLVSSAVVGVILLLVVLALIPGCSSVREAKLGTNYRDKITESDPHEGSRQESNIWWYHVYSLNVEAGRTYEFTLTTHNGMTTGIWGRDKYESTGRGFIVEVSPSVRTRTARYTFEHGGKQKILVEAAQVPAEYSFEVTRR
jgi:hypothetical protein